METGCLEKLPLENKCLQYSIMASAGLLWTPPLEEEEEEKEEEKEEEEDEEEVIQAYLRRLANVRTYVL